MLEMALGSPTTIPAKIMSDMQPHHDPGKDNERHAVADPAIADLLAEPHDERRAGGQRDDGHQYESPARVGDEAPITVLQSLRDAERLDDGEGNGQIAGPLRNLTAAQLAFFLKFFERRHHDRQELQDDGCRDVGHDAQGENGEPPDVAAREQVEEAEDAAGIAREEVFPPLRVDTRRGNVAAQAIHRQHGEREQDSLAQIGNAKYVGERFKKLHGSFASKTACLRARLSAADYDRFTAGRLNLLERRLRKQVRFHPQFARQLAGSQDLQPLVEFLDDAVLEEVVGCERVPVQFLQSVQINDCVLLLKDIRKTALGQAAVQRHLAALEAALLAEAGAGPLSLAAAGGGLAVARSHTAPDTLAHVLLPGGGFQSAKIHTLAPIPLPSADAGLS